ncbi:Oidioi.mRNA.OKI2018_I69.PAR.g9537.t1.cds [Oikopleura dioica]|uniref:Oidioi.mRNA.OKI2018_I69.PAR.g9537.t1.cds n=1 Tax=Oikopleura dioica TaxID=34765 RepID=A0ABN7RL84_OIKDI|nr:Oidioi.mRNA.OKI2018_I69.PAR.g9537.t1.cds [Oikopleura dioica]
MKLATFLSFFAATAFAALSNNTNNPNGYDPLFDWNIVNDNEYLKEYNVTYTDLINKPIQLWIWIQAVWMQGQVWYQLSEQYGNGWVEKFSRENVDSRCMINWARDMEVIVEEFMAIVEFSIEDWAQLLYPAPCCMYDPDEIRALYLVPYQEAITKVLAWSGEWTYRYWEMLFGYNGWVEVGQGWVVKWETDFEWHKLSDVTHYLRVWVADLERHSFWSIEAWEDIICGPREEITGTCTWKTVDGKAVAKDVFHVLDILVDKLDETLQWFSLVIGNIIDATANKNDPNEKI